MEYNLKITNGIHIIIDYYHLFKSLVSLNKNVRINITIDYDTFLKNRNDVCTQYLKMYNSLVREIFCELQDNITFYDNYTNSNINFQLWNYSADDLLIEKNFVCIHANNFFKKYTIENIKVNYNYICINTKIVNSSQYYNNSFDKKYNFIEKYKSIKNALFSIINNSGISVILLGERNIPECNEYRPHNEIYGTYIMVDDFKKNINNLCDETYNDSKDSYNIDLFKKSCYYLTHSKMNIFIGNGGGIHLYSNFLNTIQLGVKDRLLDWIDPINFETNMISAVDTDMFIDTVQQYLKK